MMKNLLLTFCLVAVLMGCSTIHTYVKGWPELNTKVNVIPDGDIYETCTEGISWVDRYVLLTLPLACAKVNLTYKTCNVYIGETSPKPILDHELAHCKGGDHGGKAQMLFDKWKAIQ